MGWGSLCHDWFLPSEMNGVFWPSQRWLNFLRRAGLFVIFSLHILTFLARLLCSWGLFMWTHFLYHKAWELEETTGKSRPQNKGKVQKHKCVKNEREQNGVSTVYFTFMRTERLAEFWWFLLTLYRVIFQYLELKGVIRPRKIRWDLFMPALCFKA